MRHRPPHFPVYFFLAAIAAIALLWKTPAYAEETKQNVRQYKIEAAYLYGFFNYITWPEFKTPEALTDAVICIYGNDPIRPYLEYIARKPSTKRSLKVRRVDTLHRDCHIFFMRNVAPDDIPLLAKRAWQHNTIFISQSDWFLDHGGAIKLSPQAEGIALSVHHTDLKQHGFEISSRLLQLARGVK